MLQEALIIEISEEDRSVVGRDAEYVGVAVKQIAELDTC